MCTKKELSELIDEIYKLELKRKDAVAKLEETLSTKKEKLKKEMLKSEWHEIDGDLAGARIKVYDQERLDMNKAKELLSDKLLKQISKKTTIKSMEVFELKK